ncbi:hypothetical protein NCCP2716_25690 [Sporosarcina sp. NCCP-2716]|uniref:hypothetical protein n=1 Tax=Sporosarcina sp. NCCP-2716 TaxID=2943679 RepID=UPI00203B86B0|nr:hypothetical protein [Sporosarcina sp. NCCP-2716]GKV70071.1 hypothetical protein NCCP2716_25690 [Sporosarcina sp. NCCP-2716]
MKKLLFISVFLFAFMPSLGGCSKGITEVKEVRIYEMESFSEVKQDSLVIYTEPMATKQFEKAFRSAKKKRGKVDITDPEYKVELGEKTYFLWLSQESGTIMDVEDTNTIYSLIDSSVENLNDIFRSSARWRKANWTHLQRAKYSATWSLNVPESKPWGILHSLSSVV